MKNCHFWAAEHPTVLNQKPHHSANEIWSFESEDCSVLFFLRQNCAGVTVNSKPYVSMLRNFWRPRFEDLGSTMAEILFQQDTATACCLVHLWQLSKK